jgi:nucleotide-binding universal stress UspA family protein
MKILLAVDGSEDSKRAIEEVARRNWDAAKVKMLYVVEIPAPPVPDLMGVGYDLTREIPRESTEHAEKMLATLAETLKAKAVDKSLEISTEAIIASPLESAAQVIVNEAKSNDADLIVIGSRGLSRWKQLLLGSVSMAVAQHAPCSVEIVRVKK